MFLDEVVDGDGEDVVDLGGVPGRFLLMQKLQQLLAGVDGLLSVDAELGRRLRCAGGEDGHFLAPLIVSWSQPLAVQ